ncbi:unnamed protein product [Blepharisma stoltei]|uniref:Protein TIC 214 n=1 Tax=Blepharisma stoltei TaxID=1481888 RepID=A0AAU9IN53_9CILI|nr:unnamed protein product [Blepharisma stoltei]
MEKKTHEELENLMTLYLSNQKIAEDEAVKYKENKLIWAKRMLKNKDIQEILTHAAQEVSLIMYSDLAQKTQRIKNPNNDSTTSLNSPDKAQGYIEELARLEEEYNKYTQSTMNIMKKHLKKIDNTIAGYYAEDNTRDEMIYKGLKIMQNNPPKWHKVVEKLETINQYDVPFFLDIRDISLDAWKEGLELEKLLERERKNFQKKLVIMDSKWRRKIDWIKEKSGIYIKKLETTIENDKRAENISRERFQIVIEDLLEVIRKKEETESLMSDKLYQEFGVLNIGAALSQLSNFEKSKKKQEKMIEQTKQDLKSAKTKLQIATTKNEESNKEIIEKTQQITMLEQIITKFIDKIPFSPPDKKRIETFVAEKQYQKVLGILASFKVETSKNDESKSHAKSEDAEGKIRESPSKLSKINEKPVSETAPLIKKSHKSPRAIKTEANLFITENKENDAVVSLEKDNSIENKSTERVIFKIVEGDTKSIRSRNLKKKLLMQSIENESSVESFDKKEGKKLTKYTKRRPQIERIEEVKLQKRNNHQAFSDGFIELLSKVYAEKQKPEDNIAEIFSRINIMKDMKLEDLLKIELNQLNESCYLQDLLLNYLENLLTSNYDILWKNIALPNETKEEPQVSNDEEIKSNSMVILPVKESRKSSRESSRRLSSQEYYGNWRIAALKFFLLVEKYISNQEDIKSRIPRNVSDQVIMKGIIESNISQNVKDEITNYLSPYIYNPKFKELVGEIAGLLNYEKKYELLEKIMKIPKDFPKNHWKGEKNNMINQVRWAKIITAIRTKEAKSIGKRISLDDGINTKSLLYIIATNLKYAKNSNIHRIGFRREDSALKKWSSVGSESLMNLSFETEGQTPRHNDSFNTSRVYKPKRTLSINGALSQYDATKQIDLLLPPISETTKVKRADKTLTTLVGAYQNDIWVKNTPRGNVSKRNLY